MASACNPVDTRFWSWREWHEVVRVGQGLPVIGANLHPEQLVDHPLPGDEEGTSIYSLEQNDDREDVEMHGESEDRVSDRV